MWECPRGYCGINQWFPTFFTQSNHLITSEILIVPLVLITSFVSTKELQTPIAWFKQALYPDLVCQPQCPPQISNCPLVGRWQPLACHASRLKPRTTTLPRKLRARYAWLVSPRDARELTNGIAQVRSASLTPTVTQPTWPHRLGHRTMETRHRKMDATRRWCNAFCKFLLFICFFHANAKCKSI